MTGGPGTPAPAAEGPGKKNRGFPWLAWLPLLAYSGLIFYLSSREKPALPTDRIPNSDKALHFLAYGGWAFLCGRALQRTLKSLDGWRWFGAIVLAATLYGMTDEFHQSFVPGRDASLEDLLADFLGAATSALALLWWRHHSCKRVE